MDSTIPKHLGIIVDGNRRWAKEKGLPTLEGHKRGLDAIRTVIEAAKKRHIKTLSIFCFSTENWHRSKEEVDYLMDLMEKAVNDFFKKFSGQNVKLRVIGQIERLPESIQKKIAEIEKETAGNEVMIVNLAMSYGGRVEIVEAFKNILKKGIKPDDITEEVIKDNLWTTDVDLIIRTGGEQRLSGFLIWQAAYSEILFVKKYWPDFSEADLDAALDDYASRQRRFGK